MTSLHLMSTGKKYWATELNSEIYPCSFAYKLLKLLEAHKIYLETSTEIVPY